MKKIVFAILIAIGLAGCSLKIPPTPEIKLAIPIKLAALADMACQQLGVNTLTFDIYYNAAKDEDLVMAHCEQNIDISFRVPRKPVNPPKNA